MEEKKVTHSFFIAGVQHHRIKDVFSDMVEGDILILDPEPSNRFDPNAVKIIFDNGAKRAMLGYVPKKYSSEVSAMFEIGKSLKCELVQFNKGAKPWEQAKVEISEVTNE